MDPPSSRPRDLRLLAYVAAGTAAGVIYVLFDVLSEARLERGTLTGPLADLHALVDHVVPILIGALLGVGAHYLRLRAQLSVAVEAASRADALRARLLKVERDQAVWVLAAAVLHELNNPLHALGLLLDELDTSGGDEARRIDLARRARAQADRALSHLRVLRAMRGTGEPEFQQIALEGVVRAVAADVGQLALESGLAVEVHCERPVRAMADPAYVRTILENLLDNSLCSLRERGHGVITIRLEMGAGHAVVRVGDDGPPLDGDVRAELFDPLRTTKTQGLGLGLPIARALARAMRGDLALDEGPGKAFLLELPLGGSAS